MRTEPRVLIGAGLFGAMVAVVYWFLSYEQAGTVMLLFIFDKPGRPLLGLS